VTLVSASLGIITAKEQEKKVEEEEVLPHLMVLVDLQKGKESNCFLPYLALVYLRHSYNFIAQAVGDSVGMSRAKAGRQKRAIAKLPNIVAVNGKSLHTTAAIQHMVRIRNSTSVKRCHVIKFVIADIAG
jgi:hypothetical protein